MLSSYRMFFLLVGVLFCSLTNAQWESMGNINTTIYNYSSLTVGDTDNVGNFYMESASPNSNGKNYVSVWNGSTWSELGGTNSSTFNGFALTLDVKPDGTLYAAGDFTNANGKHYVAKWNGSNWSEVGGGNTTTIFNNQITSIAADNVGNVYGCTPTLTNTNGKYMVVKWNGSTWSELGGINNSSFNGQIQKLKCDAAGNLYALGYFTNANGKYFVAKWNGSSWSEIGGAGNSTFNGIIYCIAFDNSGNLYVGGGFTNVNGKYYVAKWNGNSWSEIGGAGNSSFNSYAMTITMDANENIYASGYFKNANNRPYVAIWNGSNWAQFGDEITGSFPQVNELKILKGNRLFINYTTAPFAFPQPSVALYHPQPPRFNSRLNTLSLCENAGNSSLNNFLMVNCDTANETITYSVITNPTHGILTTGTNINLSNLGSNAVAGWSYTPTGGYVGADKIIINFTSSLGIVRCDTINIAVNTPTTSITNTAICSSALPYSWNSNSYSVAGTYLVHLTNANGCDSAATLNLTIKATSTFDTAVALMPYQFPYTWRGTSYQSAGVYTKHYTNSMGCDSAATLTIVGYTAPSISYTGPQYYNTNEAITPLVPKDTVTGPVPAAIPFGISAFVGKGSAGSTGGTGTNAAFYGPTGMARDASGNLYIVDTYNHLIRKINAAGTVSTIAGDGYVYLGYGKLSNNATGTSASFNYPTGVVVDKNSTYLYIADKINNVIRKISLTSPYAVTTFAGTSSAGSADNATGTSATFNNPEGIAINGGDTMYIADRLSNKIRRITPAGAVSTFAGSGTAGSTDASGTLASFNNPTGLVLDAAGNVYVADFGSNKIRKISPAGVVSTLAGSGTASSVDGLGTAATFNGPHGLTIDKFGNLYVADQTGNKIRKVTPTGLVTTIVGTGVASSVNNVVGTSATINQPTNLLFNAAGDTLYVSDYAGDYIRKISLSGYSISPTLPAGLSFDGTNGTISGTPTAVTAMTSYTVMGTNSIGSDTAVINIKVCAATSSTTTITIKVNQLPYSWNGLVFTTSGTQTAHITNVAGCDSAATLVLNVAPSISYAGPQVYTVGQAITPLAPSNSGGSVPNILSGEVSTFAGSTTVGYTDGANTVAQFNAPSGLAFDNNGNLLVADINNKSIRKITSTGDVSTFATTGKAVEDVVVDDGGNVYAANAIDNTIQKITPGGVVSVFASGFNLPSGIGIDALGNLFVADQNNNQIKKITPAGVVSIFAGTGTAGSANGAKATATFDKPWDVAVDITGNVYVSDQNNNLIRKIDTTGIVTTFATGFWYPKGITVDAKGNVYVADYSLDQIKKISPSGVVTILAGQYNRSGYVDGPGISARFNYPTGVAVDSKGNVFVGDYQNFMIRKISSIGYSISPALPTGLRLDTTGSIIGKPTVLSAATTYSVIATNAVGSDTATVNISVTCLPTTATISRIACGSYTWHGTTYTNSGVYTFDSLNKAGCDSLTTLNLTINKLTRDTINQNACSSYAWHGTTYTNSGVYTFDSLNKAGCDSLTILNLTINKPTTDTIRYTACGSYTWHGITYTKNGFYTFDSLNKAGCDSLTTLDLTIALAPATFGYTTPDTFKVGTAITVLSPAIKIDSVGSRFIKPVIFIKMDQAGNYFVRDSVGLKKVAAGNGAITTLNSDAGISGLTVDATGNVYYASLTDGAIHKITPAGNNTVIITGLSGYVYDLALDTTGNFYASIAPPIQNAKGALVKIGQGGQTTVIDSGYFRGLALDKAGNIYVNDIGNINIWGSGKVKKINPAGIKTIIGTGYENNLGIALDAAGNVFITDQTNNAINKIGNDGSSKIVATGFYVPVAIALDSAMNIYVGDVGRTTVLKIPAGDAATGYSISPSLPVGLSLNTTTGEISGNPTVSAAFQNYTVTATNCTGSKTTMVNIGVKANCTPTTGTVIQSACGSYTWHGTTYTASGSYTFDSLNKSGCDSLTTLNLTIKQPTTATIIQSACSSYTWHGTTYTASGSYTFDSLNKAGCDSLTTLNLTINQPTTASLTQTSFDSYTWHGATYTSSGSYTFDSLNKAGCDSLTTLILTINYNAPSVFNYTSPDTLKVGSAMKPLSPLATNEPGVSIFGSGFSSPWGLTTDAAGNVYIADHGNGAIKKIATNGTVTTISSGYGLPVDLAIDTAGNIYVVNTKRTVVEKISPNGTISTIGSGFSFPGGVAVDVAGNVYVADVGNNAVKKISPNGTISSIGSGFSSPSSVAVDASGNVYVSDFGSGTVKKVATNGITVTTLGVIQSPDAPNAVAVDGIGNVYVACIYGIKKIETNGTISAIGGGFSFNVPYGIALDATGNIYVGDTYNNQVEKITPGVGAVSSYSINPALPAGISLNTTTGIISGTPTVTSSATNYTVTASNLGGSVTSVVNIMVVSSSQPNYVWTGNVSRDWNTAGNWSNGVLPIAGVQLTIPAVALNQPLLTADMAINNDVLLEGSLTIGGKTLTLGGSITGSGKLIGSSGSSLVMNATVNNTINFGTTATDSLLANLTLSSTGTLTLGSGLGITSLLTVNAGTLNTGNHLTLKSTSILNTAVVGPVGGTITGNVTVERYIPKHIKSYQSLTTGGVYNAGNIFNNWQERGVNNNGYGIFVTGKAGVAAGVDATTGFDISPAGYKSMYNYFNYLTYSTVNNTKNTNLDPYTGYLTVVYGNRALPLIPSAIFDASANMNAAATIRTTGSLVTGTVTFSNTGVTNSNFSSAVTKILPLKDTGTFIANPYACAIDWNSLSRTNVTNTYYYYEPTYTTGGYQSFVSYNSVAGTNSNPLKSKINNYIQPGQGFWLMNSSTVTSNRQLVITEANKVTNQPFTAVFGTGAAGINRLAMSLWKEGENIDGTVAVFDNNFTSAYGDEDSKKLFTSGENLFIAEGNNNLCIDGLANPTVNDVISLQTTGMTVGKTYTIQLDAQEFNSNGLNAYLVDATQQTEHLLIAASNTYSFTAYKVNDNRFSVVFKAGAALPVKFISIKANQGTDKQTNDISWTVANEVNIDHYEVEQSATGKDYAKIVTKNATNNSVYAATDNAVHTTTNYYRIKAVDKEGKYAYSQVVKVSATEKASIAVAPNPVRGDKVTVQMNNLEAGKYTMSLYNNAGQLVASKEVTHTTGNTTIELPINATVANGVYSLRVIGVNNYTTEVIISRR